MTEGNINAWRWRYLSATSSTTKPMWSGLVWNHFIHRLVITDYRTLGKEPNGMLSLTVINEELAHGRPFYVWKYYVIISSELLRQTTERRVVVIGVWGNLKLGLCHCVLGRELVTYTSTSFNFYVRTGIQFCSSGLSNFAPSLLVDFIAHIV